LRLHSELRPNTPTYLINHLIPTTCRNSYSSLLCVRRLSRIRYTTNDDAHFPPLGLRPQTLLLEELEVNAKTDGGKSLLYDHEYVLSSWCRYLKRFPANPFVSTMCLKSAKTGVPKDPRTPEKDNMTLTQRGTLPAEEYIFDLV
jgi:hypothetical protein